jgi:type IV pilus assembly protein PilO
MFFLITGVTLTGQQSGTVGLRVRVTTYLRSPVGTEGAENSAAGANGNAAGAAGDGAAGGSTSAAGVPDAGGRR